MFAAPERHSALVGFLRAGAIVQASPDNESGPGCTNGYAKIFSSVRAGPARGDAAKSDTTIGYVCLDNEATRDLLHPIVQASNFPPDLAAKLP